MSGSLRERLEHFGRLAARYALAKSEVNEHEAATAAHEIRDAILADYEPIDGLTGDDYGTGISTVGVEESSGELELRLNVGNRHGSVFISREFWAAVGEKAGWSDAPPWTMVEEDGLPDCSGWYWVRRANESMRPAFWARSRGTVGMWCVNSDGPPIPFRDITHWTTARIPTPPELT